jgi:hypothetical protein
MDPVTPKPPPGELDAVDLVLAVAAAETPDELAAARLAAIRSRHLRDDVPATPGPYDRPAGVYLLGGLVHDPDAAQSLTARIGRITRRVHGHQPADDPADQDGDDDVVTDPGP